ncbi:MAG: hypothetical protein ABIV50_10250 [Opitutus sp.]
MSLINEALKKAQRQRSDEPAGMSYPTERGDYRVQPKTTQTIVLIGAGAAVLVVLSVVITVYLLNRTPAAATPPPLATSEAARAPAVAEVSAPSPVIVPPLIAPPPANTETRPPSETATSTVAVSAPAPASTTPAAVAAAPIAIPPIAPLPPAERQPDLQTQLFVDSIRVMGIRSQGGESKVMMNDRVYRVNDIVDRARVLKLVKVEPELLTFTDPNGMVYTKSF